MLWTALLTYPLMYVIQEMCARIAIITSKSLTGVIKENCSKYLLWLVIILVIPAIIFNIAADIAAMSAVIQLLFPSIPTFITSWVIVISTLYLVVFNKFNAILKVMKFFCLFMLCYMIVPFLVGQDWGKVLSATFIPEIQLDKNYLFLLVAVLGTTISPYLFFFQASISLEAKQHEHHKNKILLSEMRTDVNSGMFLSNLVMYFIILTTASVLFTNGVKDIKTVEQAAQALQPLAGDFAYHIFALGVLGLGMLSIPVLSVCIGYILAEIFYFKKELDRKFVEAKGFYVIIGSSLVIAGLINFWGIDPIQSLIWTAVLYGLITPVLLAVILYICNQKKIMKKNTNTLFTNVLGIVTLLLMTAAALLLIFL